LRKSGILLLGLSLGWSSCCATCESKSLTAKMPREKACKTNRDHRLCHLKIIVAI
jgi:hypothetical protein